MSGAQAGITVVGNTNLDIMVSGTAELPKPGTEAIVPGIDIRLGGSAGNLAVRCAGLGQDTVLVSRVGDDASTRLVEQELALPGLSAILVRDTALPSGITVAVEAPGRDRAFISSLGAMAELTPRDVPASALGAGTVVLAGYFLLPKLRGNAAAGLFAAARSNGALTVLDTGWPAEGWTEEVRAEVRGVLDSVDLFLPNNDELTGLTGNPDPQAAALLLAGQTSTLVAVKLGADGAGLALPDGTWLHSAARPVMPVDSTGAGDGFNAAFLACLARRDTPAQALAAAVSYATELVATAPERRSAVVLPETQPLSL
ncbi:carbohydrate kinase family protein [Arthrobacter gandavensis]|uniref:carbohydrate kinase family protein n=1 Tax=Arthrobacter gandavensis TaxID=169960 RepID=UPI00188F72A3|nr:carbohydrate kinase family protein [Arthrobacter gandavensis]MBF4993206.1 carbohydrate kinase family protein [Arthrobacter gandavensis]